MCFDSEAVIEERKRRAQAKRVRRTLRPGSFSAVSHKDREESRVKAWDDARAKRKQIARAKARAREEILEEIRGKVRAIREKMRQDRLNLGKALEVVHGDCSLEVAHGDC